MTNSIKYLFLLILCLGIFAVSTSAQYGVGSGSDQILVNAGKKTLRQSDVDKLIEFYEWAFAAKFNADERDRFREYTAEEFRSNPAEHRKTIDDIVTMLPKIFAAAPDVREKTRTDFLAEFMPEARRHTDENSKMLIEIYERAQNGESSVADSNSENSNVRDEIINNQNTSSTITNAGNVSVLAGKWVWGRSGSSTYATGGAYMGSNGSRFTYQFSPNGAVEYTGIMNVMTGGCRMQIFKSARGKASLSGDTLVINWSPASFSRDDSCSPSKNYKKTLPAEIETFKIAFKDSYGERQLCLTGKDETCFSPEK